MNHSESAISPRRAKHNILANVFIAGAFLLTFAVVGWSFSAPFRQRASLLPERQRVHDERDAIMGSLTVEEFQQQMLNEHHVRLKEIRTAKKRQQQSIHTGRNWVPSEVVQATWAKQRKQNQERLAELRAEMTPEDEKIKTLRWSEAEYLARVLADE